MHHSPSRALLPAALVFLSSSAAAGVFGVPTNLAVDGRICTAAGAPDASCVKASSNPGSWFTVTSRDAGSTNGDIVHQIRFFIEVTGTTLDIKVFDPGISAARDQTAGAAPAFNYTLFNPAGTPLDLNGGADEGGPLAFTADNATTDDRLARFSCNNGAAPTFVAANAGTVFGTGAGGCAALPPGLYVFEIDTTLAGTGLDVNAFGLVVTDSAGNPYDVYTIGSADNTDGAPGAAETSMLIGTINPAASGNSAETTNPTAFFPYVQRGCTVEPSNFDADAGNAPSGTGVAGSLTDVLGATTVLTMSAGDNVALDTVTVEAVTGRNRLSDNYGLYELRYAPNTSPNNNWADFRVADWQGSVAGAPATFPRQIATGREIRIYLPNGYGLCEAGSCQHKPPLKPILTASAVVASGPNPPTPSATTRYVLTASIFNPSSFGLSGVSITLPFETGNANVTETVVAGSDFCFLDGGQRVACTVTNGTSGTLNFRRASGLVVPAGRTLSFQYLVDFAVNAAGGAFVISGVPTTTTPADRTVNASFTSAWATTESLGPICGLRDTTAAVAGGDADLILTKVGSPLSQQEGANVVFEISVTNDGPATATAPVVTDTVSAPFNFQSISAPGYSCVTPGVGATGVVTCTRSSNLPAGDTDTINLVVQVAAGTAAGTVARNTASVASATADPASGNNTATDDTWVLAAAGNTTCSATPTAGTVVTGGVLNDYWPGVLSAPAGSTSIQIGSRLAGGAAINIAAGDLLLVIQMQDGEFDSSNTDAYGDGVGGDIPNVADPAPTATSPFDRQRRASGSLSTGSAGRYEYVRANNAVGAAGGTLVLAAPLVNDYKVSNPAFSAAGSNGQRSFQVIRVRTFTNLTLNANVTPIAWQGTTAFNSGGGVVALDVSGTLNFAGFAIDASTRGFRGGRGFADGNDNPGGNHIYRATNNAAGGDNEGMKGEGIHGAPFQSGGSSQSIVDRLGTLLNGSGYPGAAATDGPAGMGAPGNAGGGGSYDAAGGGGANAGGGGIGGDEYCRTNNGPAGDTTTCALGDGSSQTHTVGHTGGRGGRLDFVPSSRRVVLGGGGGGGANHNSDNGHGGVGGGIVLLRLGATAPTNATAAVDINVNGANGITDASAGNGGGGGAGGSVVVLANVALPASMMIQANGGRGANSTDHAPGGGGGGGFIAVPTTSLATTSVLGGIAGLRGGADMNARAGQAGLAATVAVDATNDAPARADGCSPAVDLLVGISSPQQVLAGGTISYPISVSNNGPAFAPNATLTIPVPEGTTFASMTPPVGWTCSTPAPGGTGLIRCVRTAAMPSGTSESFTLVTNVPAATPANTTFAATASVSTSTNETTVSNNQATATTLVVGAISALTRAEVAGFKSFPEAGTVEFLTGSQKNTRSFRVFVSNLPTGADRREITFGPVQSPQPNSSAPIAYTLTTRAFTEPFVFLEEEELNGRLRSMGPFEPGDGRLSDAFDRTVGRMTRAGAVSLSVPGASVLILPSADFARSVRLWQGRNRREGLRAQRSERRGRRIVREGIKLVFAGGGEMTVRRADLEAEGMPDGTRTRALRLYSLGVPVPFRVVNERTPDEAIVFTAAPVKTAYTDQQAFLLTWNPHVSPASANVTSEGDPVRPGWHRVERDVIYSGTVELGGDPWLWDLLVADGSNWPSSWDPTAGAFDLPGLAAASSAPDVPVRLRVLGRSDHEHSVVARINGEVVGSLTFEGSVGGLLEGNIPRSSLKETGNELTIEYFVNGSTDLGLAYLDWLDLGISIPRPVRLLGADNIEPYNATLPSLKVDYLIVSHPDFMEQSARIAELKRSEGLSAAVVSADRAYDRFSGGFFDARAIASLIRTAKRQHRLKYVLLVGDDTIDYRNVLLTTPFPVLPSLQGWDDESGRTPSENLFADVDGDGLADVAIGRLPVQTDEEADALVAKIARQASAIELNRGRHVLVADNQIVGDPNFTAEAQVTMADFPPGTTSTLGEIAKGVGTAQTTMLSGLAAGAQALHYFGHGGPAIWADEQVLSVADVPDLGSLPETVVFTWSCQSSYYTYFYGPSVNEALVLLPNGGALAAFGPSGISNSIDQEALYRALYSEASSPEVSLGEAIRRAKRRAYGAPGGPNVVTGFNLLGDPALRLRGLGPSN